MIGGTVFGVEVAADMVLGCLQAISKCSFVVPPSAAFSFSQQSCCGRLVGARATGVLFSLVHATADNLTLEDGFFDRAMAVHVLYFWRDLAKPLKEMARVLKPGGVLVLLFRPPGGPRVAAFPEQVYTFRTAGEVTAALEATRFQIDWINPPQVDGRSVPMWSRPCEPATGFLSNREASILLCRRRKCQPRGGPPLPVRNRWPLACLGSWCPQFVAVVSLVLNRSQS